MKYWNWCCLIVILACSTATAANKKIEIEVVSLTVSMEPKGSIVESYQAKIILPDGSHALAVCLNDNQVCDLDNGYPERLKHTSNTSSTVYTGFSKFQAKRTGKQLMIYTATGKREYWIQDSW
jgi:hypothetical protein